jgi:signal transduction histidine kinase
MKTGRRARVPAIPSPTPATVELQRRADLLTAAMELEGMAAWSWDRSRDHVTVEYRAQAANFMRTDEPTMTSFLALVHEEDRSRVESAIQTALTVPGIHKIEFRFRAENGSERWIGSTLKRYLEPGGQPAGLIGASRDITARKEAYRQIAGNEQRLRELSQEIIDAASREQERIGHDLHDGLGQELTGIALMLKALQGQLDGRPADLKRSIDEILGLLGHALASTRSIAGGLSPVAVEHGGLIEALRAMAAQTRQSAGVKIRLTLDRDAVRDLPTPVALHLYRIAQEALSNAIRHSGATQVSLSLGQRAGTLRLAIADNGAGLGARKGGSDGLGLHIMQYRAQLIGARLDMRRPPRGGTAVVVTWQPGTQAEARP